MSATRQFPDRPLVGVGAVIISGDRVVLIRRGHPPLKGEWSLPGGVVELGETLEEALAREVVEEAGIEVEIGAVVEVLDRVQHADDGRVEYHFVIVDYLCRARSEAVVHGSDAEDVRWVALDELHTYRLTPKADAVVRKAFEMAAKTGA